MADNMADEAIRIKHTTTEIEIPREDERLVEIIVGLLSGTSQSAPLGVRVSQNTGGSALISNAAPDPAVEIPTTAGVVSTPASSRRKTRSSGIRRPNDAFITPGRKPQIDQVCGQGPEDGTYNAAIRRHTQVGMRGLLVMSLARERADLSGLSIPEIASILERKFRVPTTLNAVGLALTRMATKADNPLVTGSEASWDRSKTEYWLTEAGLTHVKGILGG